MGLQQDIPCWEIGLLKALEHGCHCHRADVGAVLMLCSERYWKKAGILDVIDTDNAHFVGHSDSNVCEAGHEASGCEVIGADNCFRPTLKKVAEEIVIIRVAATNQILLGAEAMSNESFTIASDARKDG